MTRMERWIYRDMLDVYYDNEGPFPNSLDKICAMVGARRDEDRAAVAAILVLKFVQTDAGYLNERCEIEIAAYKAKAEIAQINGKKGGRPPKNNPEKPSGFPSGSDQLSHRNPDETGSKANHEPVTSNQEPQRRADARGTRLPADWKPSHEDALYCKSTRPDLRPSEVAQSFYDFWIAKAGAAGRKADWAATWRTWVRNEKPGKESVAPKEKDWI